MALHNMYVNSTDGFTPPTSINCLVGDTVRFNNTGNPEVLISPSSSALFGVSSFQIQGTTYTDKTVLQSGTFTLTVGSAFVAEDRAGGPIQLDAMNGTINVGPRSEDQ